VCIVELQQSLLAYRIYGSSSVKRALTHPAKNPGKSM
jgi:hypothetical protein